MNRRQNPKPEQSEFMKYIEHHERTWGQEVYPSRPNLSEILSSPVVVFWKTNDKSKRHTITLHDDLKAVEDHFFKMIFRAEIGETRVPVRIFENQKRMVIKAVKIVFGEPTNN